MNSQLVNLLPQKNLRYFLDLNIMHFQPQRKGHIMMKEIELLRARLLKLLVKLLKVGKQLYWKCTNSTLPIYLLQTTAEHTKCLVEGAMWIKTYLHCNILSLSIELFLVLYYEIDAVFEYSLLRFLCSSCSMFMV